jgi:Holliday junction resolvase
MAKKSRTKGRGGELELAKILNGERTSQTGLASPDVTAGPEYDYAKFEVKRRKQTFTTLYDALAQAQAQGGHLVAVRDDRQPWLIVMPLDNWKELTREMLALEDMVNEMSGRLQDVY